MTGSSPAQPYAARLVLIPLALATYGCGATPLSRHARAYGAGNDTSVLDEALRAHLDGSLGTVPSEESVAHRLALIAAAPAALSTTEARALLESTLDWVQLLRTGWQPPWIEQAPVPSREDLDVIGDLTGEPSWSALARTTAAVRGTRALLERSARGADATRAWRASMIEIHGAPDECGEDGEEGAVAAAVRAYLDETGGEIESVAREVELTNELVDCHVAALDGGARVSPDAREHLFARSCWVRGGPPDGECQPQGDGRGGHRPEVIAEPPPGSYDFAVSWYRWIDSLEDDQVVYVTIGGSLQANRVVVVWRDAAWRVIVQELAWTS